MSICVSCGKKRVRRRIVQDCRRDGVRVTVPAFVCDACGERVFDLNVLSTLEQR